MTEFLLLHAKLGVLSRNLGVLQHPLHQPRTATVYVVQSYLHDRNGRRHTRRVSMSVSPIYFLIKYFIYLAWQTLIGLRFWHGRLKTWYSFWFSFCLSLIYIVCKPKGYLELFSIILGSDIASRTPTWLSRTRRYYMSDPEIICQTSRVEIYMGPRYYLGVQDSYVGLRDNIQKHDDYSYFIIFIRHITTVGLYIRSSSFCLYSHCLCFHIKFGVRQDWLLSPVLFALYMDILIDHLHSFGSGFRLLNDFCGCLLYTDDTVLLSHSLDAMRIMLDICDKFAVYFDIKFNGS